MSYIDIKFARLVGGRLDKFKEKKSGLYNFRCPYCGDSQKHQNKARGYFFLKQNDIIFKCHNCGVGRTLSNFLKDHARDLYDEFVMERYKEGLTGKHRRTPNPIIPKSKPKFKTGSNLPSISSLNKEHPARKYLEQRRIPSDKLDRLYYADKFKTYVNTQKHTFDDLRNDQPRIIIPLIDGDGNWFGNSICHVCFEHTYESSSCTQDSKFHGIWFEDSPNSFQLYGFWQLFLRIANVSTGFVPNSATTQSCAQGR